MDALFFIIAFIIFAAFYLESVFGFGAGLISVPLLAIVLGAKEAVMLVLLFQLLTGVILSIAALKSITIKPHISLAAGLLVGAAAGTFVLNSVDDSLLAKLLGITVLMYVTKEIFLKEISVKKKWHASAGVMLGTLGGFFQANI